MVIKLVELDGLGIGNLSLRNESPLAKWLWSFFTRTGSLWREIIVSRYGLHPFELVGGCGFCWSIKGLLKAIAAGLPSFS